MSLTSMITNTLRWADLEGKRTDRKTLTVLSDMTIDYLKYGVLPQEYFHFGFYKKNHNEKKSYFTYKLYSRRRAKYSNPDYENVIFQDKYIFSRVFHEYYGREAILLTKATRKEDVLNYINRVKDFVYKPLKAQEGAGIRSYHLSDYKDADQLLEDLPNCEAMLDEWIVQAPEMAKFYQKGVNCVRIYTFIHDDIFRFLDAKVTFGVGSDIVNATLDSSIFGLVDVNTGEIISDLANYNLEVFTHHPVTGFKAKGTIIPQWEEMLNLAKNAAYVVPQVAYVGWDIALTENGPVLIEGNHCGGSGGNQFCVLKEDSKGTKEVWDVMGK